jgi:hypothetical protein
MNPLWAVAFADLTSSTPLFDTLGNQRATETDMRRMQWHFGANPADFAGAAKLRWACLSTPGRRCLISVVRAVACAWAECSSFPGMTCLGQAMVIHER